MKSFMKINQNFLQILFIGIFLLISCGCSDYLMEVKENVDDVIVTYTVEHWIQNLDGKSYTLDNKKTTKQKGLALSETCVVAEEFDGLTPLEIEQKIINRDESTIIKIYYNRNVITYTFKSEGGVWGEDGNDIILSGLYGAELEIPSSPSKIGYNFGNWSQKVPQIFGPSDVVFSAVWVPAEGTAYIVEHWFQNIENDEYTKVAEETEYKTGTTDSQTEAVSKEYEGFTAKAFEQNKIAPDGSSVIQIHYDRNIIEYTFNTGMGYFSDNLTTKKISGKYGAIVNYPENPERIGYTFCDWNTSLPANFGATNIVFDAKWMANTNTAYKVNHWKQNIYDNDYTLVNGDTQNKTGTTAMQTEAAANNYVGFKSKAIEQKEIAADGSTIIDVYYDRNIIIYTFNTGCGKFSDNTTSKTLSGRYGASFNKPDNPSRLGYTFNSWDSPVPATFGANSCVFTTNWLANTNTIYKVEHYKQNLDNDDYIKDTIETLTGTTDTLSSAATKPFEGFTSLTFSQKNIEPDGSTVIEIYYNRNTITYTFNAGGGKFSDNTTSKTVSGRYGAAVNKPDTPTRIGYSFNSWSSSIPDTFGPHSSTYTSNWNANTYTVVFNANGGKGTMANEIFTYGSAKALTSNSFTRPTWDFNGWNTTSNGSGTNYSNGQSVSNLTSTNNGTVTLYAKWTYPKKLTFLNDNLPYVCDNISLTYTITISSSVGNYSKTSTVYSGSAVPQFSFHDVPVAAVNNGVTWTMSVTAVNNQLNLVYKGSTSDKIQNGKLNLTFPSMTRQ